MVLVVIYGPDHYQMGIKLGNVMCTMKLLCDVCE